MLEELKLILDSVGDLTGIALWIVGFFISYKLIVYLSMTGSIVYVCKLLITKLHDAYEKKWETSKKGYEVNLTVDGVPQDDVITGCCHLVPDINKLISAYKSSTYYHERDLRKLKAALTEGLVNDD